MKLSASLAIGILFSLLFSVLLFAAFPISQQPFAVTPCQLAQSPGDYNHKLVQITGFVSHGFEDFTIFDPDCFPRLGIWLEYGGTAASGTIYCCGVSAQRERLVPVMVEGTPTTLIADNNFQEFDKWLTRDEKGSMTRATLIGRFFAGEKSTTSRGDVWRGYGHMGCCSLFVIQQVISLDSQVRAGLDYSSLDDALNLSPKCSNNFLTPFENHVAMLKVQQEADSGQRAWSFDDPRKVATKELARLLNIPEETITDLKEIRLSEAKIVYDWNPKSQKQFHRITVSRPYWLSFYAKDSMKTAWVVVLAEEVSCH